MTDQVLDLPRKKAHPLLAKIVAEIEMIEDDNEFRKK